MSIELALDHRTHHCNQNLEVKVIKTAPTVRSVPSLKLESSSRVRSCGRNPVLVALDESSVAERALPFALALAKHWDAPMRLVHVRNPVEDAHRMDHCLIDNGASLSIQSRAGVYLESLAESLSNSNDLSVYSKTVTAVAIAETLRSMCERDAPRVLVMARTRRSNLSRFLTGSVTNRLMSCLDVPLLLVPAESHSGSHAVADPSKLTQLLVHLDGSDASQSVLDHAISIASENTIIHLRRVLPLARLYSTKRAEISHRSDIRNEAWLEMFRASEKLKRHGIECTTRLIYDGQNLASAIVAQAKAMQALVVVPAAREHLLPWWLGTNAAEHVVRQAEVPVLIVPRNRNANSHSN